MSPVEGQYGVRDLLPLRSPALQAYRNSEYDSLHRRGAKLAVCHQALHGTRRYLQFEALRKPSSSPGPPNRCSCSSTCHLRRTGIVGSRATRPLRQNMRECHGLSLWWWGRSRIRRLGQSQTAASVPFLLCCRALRQLDLLL